jgi:hypothetical protein
MIVDRQMSSSRLTIVAFSYAFALLVHAASADAEVLLDASANWGYDDNLTRASSPTDRRTDNALSTTAALQWFYAPTEYDGETLGIFGGGQAYRRYRGLDNGWIGVNAAYRHKMGLGYAAPWWLVAATSAYHRYEDQLRTGRRYGARAELGKRFDERLDAHIAAFYDWRFAAHGESLVPGIPADVYDLRGGGFDVGAAYAVTEQVAISGRFATRRGDVVSTTSQGYAIYQASNAIAEDPTFGSALYAYRLRGTTNTFSLSASWAFNDHASLSVGYSEERTNVAEGLDYRSHLATVTFQYQH